MAAGSHFGRYLQKVLPRWAEPLWANTLRDNKGGGEGKRRGKAGEEGEDRWGRKSENEREKGKRGQEK